MPAETRSGKKSFDSFSKIMHWEARHVEIARRGESNISISTHNCYASSMQRRLWDECIASSRSISE